MGAESWAAFAVALVVALAVPGPDLVLVVHSATRGVREGASAAAGIVTGLMLHALLAAAGATALLVSAPGALTAMQVLGAGVLLWIGAGMLRAARKYGIEKYGPNKYHIVTAKMGFHGRTFGAMSATGQPSCRSMIQHAIPIATPPSTASTENQKLAENASARLSSPIRA